MTLSQGLHLDFLLLPSMMIAAIGSGLLAPFAVRVVPEKVWNWVVPSYCLALTFSGFTKIGPTIISKLSG